MGKFRRLSADYWEAIGMFAGGAIMAFEFASQLYANHAISLNYAVWTGLGTFVFFGILAWVKANRKAKEAENSTNNKMQIENLGDGIAAQSVDRSPVLSNVSGTIVGRDLHQTTHNYISSIPQRIGALPSADITGHIRLKHNTSRTDNDGNELEFKFTISNDTNTDFSECAVYVDEIAYKLKKSKDWIRLDDLPSQKTLKWDAKFVLSDGFTSIGSGQRESFFLLQPRSKVFNKGELGYNYDFCFHADNVKLPESDAPNHRILIRFHGSRIVGGGVDNRFYVFLTEGKPKFKKYEKVDVMNEPAT